MADARLYPTERIKCWELAKGLRKKFYQSYVSAHEKKGIRYGGSTIGFHSIMHGFGTDVYNLAGEPYGATTAFFKDFALKCEEAAERYGLARDLCAYMRNYIGSILIQEFMLPDGTILDTFPSPDVLFSSHVCCTHSKWYQFASELYGKELGKDVPLFSVDCGCRVGADITEASIDYLTAQLLEGIEFLEKTLDRKFDDELFLEASNNELSSLSLWAQICTYNQVIPAPLDEKTVFTLYVFTTMCPHWKESADFYRQLKDEVVDRVNRGIAAVATERFRILTDNAPAWGFLQLFRYMEREYGVVSVGSFYSTGFGAWDFDEAGNIVPLRTPRELGIVPRNREEAVRTYAEFKMRGHTLMQNWSSCHWKSEFVLKMIKQWNIDAMLMHANRGCESAVMGLMENKSALTEAGVPVLPFEGSMADVRDFDYPGTVARIDMFFENLGLKKLSRGD